MNPLNLFASLFTPPPSSLPPLSLSIPSLTGSADAFLALSLAGPNRLVLALTPGLPEADRLADDLRLLLQLEAEAGVEEGAGRKEKGARAKSSSSARILEFPPLFDNDKGALGQRFKTLAALKAWGLSPYPCVIVAAFPALSTPVPPGPVPSIWVREKGVRSKEQENRNDTH